MCDNKTLLKIAHELVRKAHFCVYATNDERVISEGGLITSAKTYLKSAIVVISHIDRLEKDDEMVRDVLRMLDELDRSIVVKSNRLDMTKPIIRKKVNKLRWTANWLRNRLEKKIS